MQKLRLSAGAVVLLLISLTPATAYNQAGHMVSGSIVYSVLEKENPAALARAVELLKKHPEFHVWKHKLDELPAADRDRFLLMLACRWADDIRGNKKYTHPTWHYIDFPWKPNNQPDSLTTEEPDPENILSALKNNTQIVKSDAPEAERAVALCWVLHLVGDLHQPLHTISQYRADLPSGDAGGTRVFIIPTPSEPPLPLHFYWDDLILYNDCYDLARKRADALMKRPDLAQDQRALKADADFRQWAQESFALAKKTVYLDGRLVTAVDPEKARLLPAGYAQTAKQCAERQIVWAGYRLARLLPDILGNPF